MLTASRGDAVENFEPQNDEDKICLYPIRAKNEQTDVPNRPLRGRVWTALRWQGVARALRMLVGAAMYPTCRCGLSSAAGHNAIRAAQVPIESSHSKCTAPVGSPDPAVSTGLVH